MSSRSVMPWSSCHEAHTLVPLNSLQFDNMSFVSLPVPEYHKYEKYSVWVICSLADVYDNVPEITKRFDELNALFREKYNCDPEFYVRAPGRVNLIGEHIDYHGYFLI